MMTKRPLIILLWLLLPLSASICAQDSGTTATIAGTIKDEKAAIVVGGTVTLRNLTTNQLRTVTTDAEGSYRISALTVGDYEIRVEAAGFAPYINPKITLLLGSVATFDVTLTAGDVNALVTVTDRPPALDTSQTASTTSIDPESIEELPVNSRNYLEFTLLAPGVAPSDQQRNGGSSSRAPLADSGFSFGGLRPRSNAISIDGLDNTDETTGAARVALSPEIVREFQIVNNGLSAEFGGAGGGAINVVTRNGENDFHGDVFTFFQNERFDARDPFSEPSPRQRFHRYQPGAALGGPLKRDRLFFYAAVEQEHLAAEEQSEIDPPTRARVNSLLASGFAPALSVRALTVNPFPIGADETELAGKLTYLVGSKHTLNLRFAFTNERDRGEAFNTDSLTDKSARGSAYTKDYQFTGSSISVFTPKLINDLRLQISTRHVLTRSGDSFGPGIEIVGVARFGQPYDAAGTRDETRQQLVDNLSISRSGSEWKTGFTVNHVSLSDDARDGFGGLFIFRTIDDFASGRPAVWRQAFGKSQTNFGVTSFGAFLQNQFRVTPALMLNVGARYDVEHTPNLFRTDTNNLSPRLGLAWSPGKEWIVRGGFGLFYDRLPLAFLNRAIQKNGTSAFEQVASDSVAAQAFATTNGGRAVVPIPGIAPSIYRADPRFATPYSMQANLGFEHLIGQDVTVRANYLFTRGVHLPRTRNVNLAPPVVLTSANAVSLGFNAPSAQQLGRLVFGPARIDPAFDGVYQLENSSSSTYRGLTLGLSKRLSNEFELLASYTFSKTIDDASDFDEQPANPYNLKSDRANSRQDLRQRFVLSSLFDLPFGEEEDKATDRENEKLLGMLLSHIEVAPILTLSSGRPVNPLTGVDGEHSGAFPLVSRPSGFLRNSLRTPRFVNLDLRALKYFPFGGKRRLDLVVEFFNVFNHPNVLALNPFYGSDANALSTFGRPIAFASPRQGRFSVDFEF